MAMKPNWRGKQVSKEVKDAALQGLKDAGNVILDTSNQNAPIDEGTLINSAAITVSQDTVIISYDTPYAVVQHERIGIRHKNGRSAKFLENALKTHSTDVLVYVSDTIQKALK